MPALSDVGWDGEGDCREDPGTAAAAPAGGPAYALSAGLEADAESGMESWVATVRTEGVRCMLDECGAVGGKGDGDGEVSDTTKMIECEWETHLIRSAGAPGAATAATPAPAPAPAPANMA